MEEVIDVEEELAEVKPILCKDSCCRSHQTPKGRCYDCPDMQ